MTNNGKSIPWDSTNACDWKASTQGHTSQSMCELLAQSVARARQLQIKCNRSHSKIALMSLFVPASAEARCVKCNIPCVADHNKEALHLPKCGHLIHTYCRRHCQQKCPRCQTGFETEADEPSNDTEQRSWLHLEASYRMAQAEEPLKMASELLHHLDSAEIAADVPAFEALWDVRELLKSGGAATAKATELQVKFSEEWVERLDSYRNRAEVVLAELAKITHATVNPVYKLPPQAQTQARTVPSPQSMEQPNVTAQVPIPGIPGNGVGVPEPDLPKQGNFMSQTGKTKFFTMLTKYNNYPCSKCNRVYEIGKDYICKVVSESDSSSSKWYCVFCASGFTNGEIPAQIAKFNQSNGANGGWSAKRARTDAYKSNAKTSCQSILDHFKL